MQDLIGRTVGQYQVVERLGGGGMATVYRAVQTSLNRPIALKVLPPGLAMDPTFRERFRREATAAASLQHPNILPVYDFSLEGDVFYIAMALVTGGTLRDRIGKLSIPLALKIASQVADALDFAHNQNIIHRDIKPTNVLMARDDWSLLADFGIARLTEQVGLTAAGTGVGTPEYMSPEQAMGQPVDRRADVYSLGIMLFEMVTGKRPFTGAEAFTVMRQQVQDPLPKPSLYNVAVPPDVEAIIDKATQKSPAARYQTAAEMKAAIDQILLAISGSQSTISNPSQPIPTGTVVMNAPPRSQPTSAPRLEKPGDSSPVTSTAGTGSNGNNRNLLIIGAVVAIALVLCSCLACFVLGAAGGGSSQALPGIGQEMCLFV